MTLQRVPKGTEGARPYAVPNVSNAGGGPAHGYTPADLATAYGYNPNSGGAGQTVAIVDAFDNPNVLHDLNHFDLLYGLPAETATSFRKVNSSGAASPLPSADAGWGTEIALDVQTARAVCHKCKIILVEATSDTDPLYFANAVRTAARLGATEISNSYGGPEDPHAPLPASFQSAYYQPGVVITGSTGDNGWYDWAYANAGSAGWGDNAPNTPSSFPSVVAVGGTSLTLNGSRSETVWNSNGLSDQNNLTPNGWRGRNLGASGGGCSSTYSALPFQHTVDGYATTGCGTKRLAGDVAADADPVTGFDVYDTFGTDPRSPWRTIGGTSLASPLIAAMWALAGGAPGVQHPAQDLYDHLKYGDPATLLHDVTDGGNGFCGGDSVANCQQQVSDDLHTTNSPNNLVNFNPVLPGGWAGNLDCSWRDHSNTIRSDNTQCNAAAGYDGPSGVGTPKGVEMFKSLLPRISVQEPALKLKTPAVFHAVNFSDPLGYPVSSYMWNWGDGHAQTTTSAGVAHAYSAKGSYIVTLAVTDNHGRSGFRRVRANVGLPLKTSIVGPAAGRVNVMHNYYSSSSDPNTGGVFRGVTWRCGSSAANATVVGRSSTLHITFHHTGRHVLVLTVVDNAGLWVTKAVAVNVVS